MCLALQWPLQPLPTSNDWRCISLLTWGLLNQAAVWPGGVLLLRQRRRHNTDRCLWHIWPPCHQKSPHRPVWTENHPRCYTSYHCRGMYDCSQANSNLIHNRTPSIRPCSSHGPRTHRWTSTSPMLTWSGPFKAPRTPLVIRTISSTKTHLPDMLKNRPCPTMPVRHNILLVPFLVTLPIHLLTQMPPHSLAP